MTWQSIVRRTLEKYMIYIAFAALLAVFAVLLFDDGFLDPRNLLSIGRVTATISIMAIASVFVLSVGYIDLSIGSVVALSAVVSAKATQEYGWVAGVLAGLLVGLVVGLVNGVIATKLRVPSFLVTLGMMQIVSGTARSVSDLQVVPITDRTFLDLFGQGKVGPIESIYIWTVVVLVIGHLLYRKTTFGRHVLATGGNRLAAQYSGIRTDRVRIQAMVIGSVGAALAGLLQAGRLGGARYDFGNSDLLIVLAAVVIGGTSMFGGKGSVVGAVIGSLLIGSLTNGLILMNTSVSNQMIAQGAIIVIAVSLGSREAASGVGVRRMFRRRGQAADISGLKMNPPFNEPGSSESGATHESPAPR